MTKNVNVSKFNDLRLCRQIILDCLKATGCLTASYGHRKSMKLQAYSFLLCCIAICILSVECFYQWRRKDATQLDSVLFDFQLVLLQLTAVWVLYNATTNADNMVKASQTVLYTIESFKAIHPLSLKLHCIYIKIILVLSIFFYKWLSEIWMYFRVSIFPCQYFPILGVYFLSEFYFFTISSIEKCLDILNRLIIKTNKNKLYLLIHKYESLVDLSSDVNNIFGSLILYSNILVFLMLSRKLYVGLMSIYKLLPAGFLMIPVFSHYAWVAVLFITLFNIYYPSIGTRRKVSH